MAGLLTHCWFRIQALVVWCPGTETTFEGKPARPTPTISQSYNALPASKEFRAVLFISFIFIFLYQTWRDDMSALKEKNGRKWMSKKKVFSPKILDVHVSLFRWNFTLWFHAVSFSTLPWCFSSGQIPISCFGSSLWCCSAHPIIGRYSGMYSVHSLCSLLLSCLVGVWE
jgi:hypothetical protein